MKTEDSLGPVQLKDDEDDENKNSQNKEALEASNITIQDIFNFWSEWDLNSGIPDFPRLSSLGTLPLRSFKLNTSKQ